MYVWRDDENEASAEKPTLAPISEDPEEQTQAEAVNVNGEDQDQDDNGINFVNVEHANEAEASSEWKFIVVCYDIVAYSLKWKIIAGQNILLLSLFLSTWLQWCLTFCYSVSYWRTFN